MYPLFQCHAKDFNEVFIGVLLPSFFVLQKKNKKRKISSMVLQITIKSTNRISILGKADIETGAALNLGTVVEEG